MAMYIWHMTIFSIWQYGNNMAIIWQYIFNMAMNYVNYDFLLYFELPYGNKKMFPYNSGGLKSGKHGISSKNYNRLE